MKRSFRFDSTPVALVIAFAYVAILAATASSVGFTRDEGYYFKAAEEYSGWWGVLFSSRFFDAFTDAEIRRFFDYNHEHPAFVKLAQGVSYQLFHRALGIASPSMSFRIAGFLFAGLSVMATYALGRVFVSARVGILAALFLACLPRYFFDAHLACFDVAITAMWTLALVAFFRALVEDRGHKLGHALVSALVFGLALATKLNALFLPIIFVFAWLIRSNTLAAFSFRRGPSGGLDLSLPPIPRVLILCAILGPVLFVATWPYLWHDTFARIGGYIGFHMNHEHYPISWFHELLVRPPFPWSFPVVMTALTVPGPMLVLGVLGTGTSLHRAVAKRSLEDAVLLVALALPIFLIALPSTPIFGGVKHWYNAMPALAVLAARSAFFAIDYARSRVPAAAGSVAATSMALLALLPSILGSAASHPNGIGFYNELAGGFRGGAELGMQRGFWGGLAGPLYRELDDLPRGARIFFNRTNYDAYRMYLREGVIPGGAYYANDAKGVDVGVHFEQPEHGEKEGEIWSNLGTRPVAGVYQDNVTLVQLYRRSASSRAP